MQRQLEHSARAYFLLSLAVAMRQGPSSALHSWTRASVLRNEKIPTNLSLAPPPLYARKIALLISLAWMTKTCPLTHPAPRKGMQCNECNINEKCPGCLKPGNCNSLRHINWELNAQEGIRGESGYSRRRRRIKIRERDREAFVEHGSSKTLFFCLSKKKTSV